MPKSTETAADSATVSSYESEMLPDSEILDKIQEILPKIKETLDDQHLSPSWELKHKSNQVKVFEKTTTALECQGLGFKSMMCLSSIQGSIPEIVDILAVDHTDALKLSMIGLFRKSFYVGSVLHSVHCDGTTNVKGLFNKNDDDSIMEKCTVQKICMERPGSIFKKGIDMVVMNYLAYNTTTDEAYGVVKTIDSNGTSPTMYKGKPSERLQDFMAGFHLSPNTHSDDDSATQTSFTIYVTVPSHIFSARRILSRVSNSSIDSSSTSVSSNPISLPFRGSAVTSAMLAKFVKSVNSLVVQRRFGCQNYITLDKSKYNPKEQVGCRSCSKTFRPVYRPPQFCRLCAYFVCGKCSTMKRVTRRARNPRKMRICYECIHRVEACTFKTAPLYPQVVESKDSPNPSTTRKKQNSVEEQFPAAITQGIVRFLDSDDEKTRQASMKILKQLGATSGSNNITDNLCERKPQQLNPAAADSLHDISQWKNNIVIPLKKLDVSDCPIVESDGLRTYPLDYGWENEFPKPPEIENDTERVNKLKGLKTIANSRKALFDIIAESAAKALGSPIGAISIVDETYQSFLGAYGFEIKETPRHCSLCAYTIRQPEPFLVPCISSDVRFVNNPLNKSGMGVGAYTGFPLTTSDGYIIGALCVLEIKPRGFLTTKDYAILKKLADSTVKLMEQET